MNDALNTLIHLAIEGRVGDDDRAKLEQMLRESAEARQRYVLELDTHANLQWCFRGKKPAQTTGPRVIGRWWWGAAAMAACVLIGVTLWMNMLVGLDESASTSTAQRPSGNAAVMADARGALWSEDSIFADYSQPGQPLEAGPVSLDWGVAQFVFEQGAVVHLRGPARMIITGPNSAELVEGQLRAYVPPRARGFTVTGPGGTRVTDLGTEFIMQAAGNGAVRVDVIQGRVRLNTLGDAAGRTLTSGLAAVMAGDGRINSTDFDPSLTRRFDTPARELYQQRIAADDPLAYWPLTVDGASHGRTDLPLDPAGLSVQEPGLHASGGAARFTRGVEVASGNVTALRLNGPMTVEMWLRLDETLAPGKIMRLISLDGHRRDADGGWGMALRGTDMLRFTHYDVNDYDLRIDPLPIGQWVHLAVVVDAERHVNFYVNGQHQGGIKATQSPQFGQSLDLTIGGLGNETELYTQRLTHLAVYDRALEPRELTDHYRIGQPR